MNIYKRIVLLSTLFCHVTQYATNVAPWLEIKPSYFFFAQPPMSKIYNHGCFEIQGSVSVLFGKYLGFYGSVGYKRAMGHALKSYEKTVLSIVPVDIGLKLILNSKRCCSYFFAVGPRYFGYTQHNSSLYVYPIINGGGLGMFANTGFNVMLADCFSLGLFGEYSYENTVVSTGKNNVGSGGSVQLGGFAFGASFGYKF